MDNFILSIIIFVLIYLFYLFFVILRPKKREKFKKNDYVKLLVNKFQVDYIHYNQEYDVLHYAWKSQDAMRKFKNWANAEYRKKVK